MHCTSKVLEKFGLFSVFLLELETVNKKECWAVLLDESCEWDLHIVYTYHLLLLEHVQSSYLNDRKIEI